MLTRRAALWAGFSFVVAATGGLLCLTPQPTPPRPDPWASLAQLVPLILAQSVDVQHYARYFRLRSQRVPELRHRYAVLAARLEAACPATNPPAERQLHLENFLKDHEAEWSEFRREVLEHYAHTEAWLALGYPSWPGRPDPERISA